MPHIARQKRRTDCSAVHAIAISLGSRRLARVELGRGLGHLQHPDRSRQNMVQRRHPVFERNRRRGPKARDLGQRVHTRIGPARPLGQHIFPAQASNSRGQRALQGRPAGLHLPACELGAVIRKDESEIAHVVFRVLSCPSIFVGIRKVLLPPSRKVRGRVSYTSSLTTNFAYDLRSMESCLFPALKEDCHERLQGTLAVSFYV